MVLDERQVEQIVEMVVNKLQKEDRLTVAPTPAPATRPNTVNDGVFQDLETCIDAAAQAQRVFIALPLLVRQDIIQAVRDASSTYADEYARMEYEETGLGKLEDNVRKNQAACRVMGMEDLAPEVFSGDKGVTVIERIPVGVIASVNPVTNGAPTIIFNSIMMMAGGNTIINNPHPKTKRVSARVIRDLNRAIIDAGGPANCICCLEEPTVPSAQQLMTHPKIKLIAVTGGHGVVDFATKTGKRVIAGGPGNPPVVVDETADLDRAAGSIVEGASFSNCVACASEKEIFVVQSVADRLKELLKSHGAYEISAAQGEELLQHIFKEVKGPCEPGIINMDYIGKSPNVILQSIGVTVSPETQIVILETNKAHPLVWTEQIMPVLPLSWHCWTQLCAPWKPMPSTLRPATLALFRAITTQPVTDMDLTWPCCQAP